MTRRDSFISELKNEATVTRKVLERIPTDKFDWKPHEKSMTMHKLATHVADMFWWIVATLEEEGIDVNAYNPPKPTNTEELVALLDKNIAAANEVLEKTEDETFMQNWTLRNGEHGIFTMPKIAVLRGMVMNHIIHHRGQLSLYLRLNDIPVPSIYGPSADEQ